MKKLTVLIIAVLAYAYTNAQVNFNENKLINLPSFNLNISSDTYINKGNDDIDNLNFSSAISNFSKALEMDANNPDAYAFRGLAKYNVNDFTGSIEDLNRAIELAPNYAEAYYLRGIAKGELKYNDNACKDWKTALSLGMKKSKKLIKTFCNCR
jgi:tetratricopeptide (TPR) repeat protein